ncbi:MAG TPA: response regulator [Oligoflexus sp.]|uniref:response regulator n=1 Tax=Oligoflexus sp. TaxID=1971216 RepID=UPI002D643739|nr:response regulator [Oligoflexus sp.]HYX37742.1 response regulator [Oligoflexus sp.]
MKAAESVTVLVVDDEAASRYSTTWALNMAGYEVLEAVSGKEALMKLSEGPSLVILDINLPDITGFEVCQKIKENPATKDVPILHISACYTSPADKIQGLDLGADGYLIHPVEPPELIATVKSLLRARRSEEEARSHSRRWRATFDAINDGVAVLSAEGEIKQMNIAMSEAILQYNDQMKCEGQSILDLFAQDEPWALAARDALGRLISRPSSEIVDIAIRDRWYLGRVNTVESDAKNGQTDVVLTLVDVTERRLSANKARETEERFRLFMENVKDHLIFLIDLDGRIVDWNLGAERITGFACSDVLGKSFAKLFSEEDRQAGVPELELLNVQRKGQMADKRWYMKKDGSRYLADGFTTLLKDESGSPRGYAKISKDATDLMLAEASRRDSEERFRQLAENIREIFWLKNLETRELLYVSPTIEEVWGHGSQWFLAAGPEKLLAAVFPEDREKVQLFWERQLTAQPASEEYRVVRSDGEIRWVFDRAFPVLDLGGHFYRIAGIAEDITSRKREALELEAAKELAEEANRMKSSFLANMSHEIRTPLGAMLGFGELLRDPNISVAEREEFVTTINRNGHDLAQLIDDILDLSKVESGRLDLENLPINLSNLISDVTSSLSIKAREKGVILASRFEPEVPEIIASDPSRLRQILMNIVGNAIKFTAKGEVCVTLALEESEGAPPMVSFIVKDTGQGISASERERLFKPFAQADVSTTRNYGGTGLGLVLSRKLAQALGGDVILDRSAPGEGSTFIVRIRSSLSLSAGPGTELVKDKAEVRAPKTRSSLEGMKVLLAEDSADNRTLVKRILVQNGAEIDFAEDGAEALSKALEGNYDIVLMDMQMPNLDGYSATRELRKRGYAKPIIAITAHAMKEEREKTLTAGCNLHLSKPLNFKLLISSIESCRRTILS